RHGRRAVGARRPQALDRLQRAFVEAHALAFAVRGLRLGRDRLRGAVVQAHGRLPVLGRAHLLLDLVAEHRAAHAAEDRPHAVLADLVAEHRARHAAADRADAVGVAGLLDLAHRHDGADRAGFRRLDRSGLRQYRRRAPRRCRRRGRGLDRRGVLRLRLGRGLLRLELGLAFRLTLRAPLRLALFAPLGLPLRAFLLLRIGDFLARRRLAARAGNQPREGGYAHARGDDHGSRGAYDQGPQADGFELHRVFSCGVSRMATGYGCGSPAAVSN